MGKVATVVVVAYIALAALSVAQSVDFYYIHNYPADQARQYLSVASQTDNLTDMATYLGQGYALLAPYHGNPGWPFPTPDTSYDFIKANILSTEDAALRLSQESNLTSFAYQQAVQNLVKVTDELYADLGSANQAQGTNPYINPLGFVEIFLLALLWLPALWLDEKANDYAADKSDWDGVVSKAEKRKENNEVMKGLQPLCEACSGTGRIIGRPPTLFRKGEWSECKECDGRGHKERAPSAGTITGRPVQPPAQAPQYHIGSVQVSLQPVLKCKHCGNPLPAADGYHPVMCPNCHTSDYPVM